MALADISDRRTREMAGLSSANLEAISSRSLSNAATHFSVPGRRSTVRSDIAPSGAGVASWAISWSNRSSGASALPSEDEGGDVSGASFCDPMTVATSAAPHREAVPDHGSKRTTIVRWREIRGSGVGGLLMMAAPSRDVCLIASGSGRWCSYGSDRVTFLGRHFLGIVHGRGMYHERRGSSSLGFPGGLAAVPVRPVVCRVDLLASLCRPGGDPVLRSVSMW